MKTKNKTKPVQRKKTKQVATVKPDAATQIPEKEYTYDELPLESIDKSPLNYRQYYSQSELKELAQDIALHGIISPFTVRPVSTGRYEVVVGERRWRAANIAKLKTVSVKIGEYTDEEVIELQLSENMQRENPHPMDEALAIGRMQDSHKTIEEIAIRLGKSKSFIYTRCKLVNLIEPIREMFYADKISIKEAIEIAGIAKDSQQIFYEDWCEDWKGEDFFFFHDLEEMLSRFKYNLNDAPFNTNSKKLLPDVGACKDCIYNSATTKTLFPELDQEATCTNKTCYMRKCNAHTSLLLIEAIKEYNAEALLFLGKPSEDMRRIIAANPAASQLPQYNINEVTHEKSPDLPDQDDYTEAGEEDEEPEFDKSGYELAMQEYETEMQEYNKFLYNEKTLRGILVSETKIQFQFFIPEKPATSSTENSLPKQTTKQLQEAIKNKTATADMLQEAIERITVKEKRAKELDKEKIHLKVHTRFAELIETVSNNKLTATDMIAARLVIYLSLDYTTRQKVQAAFFSQFDEQKDLYPMLSNLTDQQFSYLIRMAVAGKSDSKYLKSVTATCLAKLAESAGVDITSIEKEQETKATEREQKVNQRVKDLEKMIKKMKVAV